MDGVKGTIWEEQGGPGSRHTSHLTPSHQTLGYSHTCQVTNSSGAPKPYEGTGQIFINEWVCTYPPGTEPSCPVMKAMHILDKNA